jgi:hypothetical protein
MTDYQLTITDAVIRTIDGAFIPNDPANRDRVTYNAWLVAGGMPSPVTPPAQTPQQQFNAALANGMNTVWTSSGPLAGLYAIDPQTQFNITAETVTILSSSMFSTGGSTRYWLNMAGTPMPMNITQFKAFAMAVSAYVDSLYAVMAARQAGQNNVQWPNNQVTINA